MPNAFPTRAVVFNKQGANNWGVPWHQDRVIAVAQKVDSAPCTNWSRKAGVWHCEPPLDVLSNMLFLRVYLGDDSADNGPMEIALGSHRWGAVSSEDANAVAADHQIEQCDGRRGDILVLNMLILHRSQPAQRATGRRVIRADYANFALPAPLAWVSAAS
jgi:ectoine hydroxylase-related dioxygenase (phytanoyl-CoA dioxygenase family)